jgi:FkbM family methyltransferase
MATDPFDSTIWWFWRRIAPTVNEPLVVEIGVCFGDDSMKMLSNANGKLKWVGFEADPRNAKFLQDNGFPVIQKAVSDEDGRARFHLSGGWTPGLEGIKLHSDSSSLQAPSQHLNEYPWCKFDEVVEVETVRLDSVMPLVKVDLMWVDVQGAQRKVIAGGQRTLNNTRYLYIECHPTPMYEGEPTFEELCALLPDFELVARWPADLLFRHRSEPDLFDGIRFESVR